MDPAVPQTPNLQPPTEPGGVTVGRVPPEGTFAACRRLVGVGQADPDAAAARLIENHRAAKIDLSLLFAACQGDEVRQVCLAVPSSGRTAAVFLSEPPRTGEPGGDETATQERAACVAAAEEHLRRELPGRVAVMQALPEPGELWCINALRMAGFVNVGDLTYLRRAIGRQSGLFARPPAAPVWPPGIDVTTLATLPGGLNGQRRMLRDLLDATYEGTLDCPALCGLRSTEDVLDSHHAVGQFDPALWFIVRRDGAPQGCMLLSKCEELRSVELVYLGLAPGVRGLGLGARLLDLALRSLPRSGFDLFTCAVDRRNTPAVKIYQRAGFRPFGERAALVKPLAALV